MEDILLKDVTVFLKDLLEFKNKLSFDQQKLIKRKSMELLCRANYYNLESLLKPVNPRLTELGLNQQRRNKLLDRYHPSQFDGEELEISIQYKDNCTFHELIFSSVETCNKIQENNLTILLDEGIESSSKLFHYLHVMEEELVVDRFGEWKALFFDLLISYNPVDDNHISLEIKIKKRTSFS